MGSTALEVQSHGQLQTHQDWNSADQVLQRVRAVQKLMEAVMKKDTHFGVIPGTKKPTLYKAGSEQILSMFRLAVDPIVEDLSTDDECRLRVICRLTDMHGRFVGAGIGECSSSEQKYKWRAAVSKMEWDYLQKHSPDRCRIKFTARWVNNKRVEAQEEQVRTEIPDVRNTILKMAKKRAQIDATLTVTSCSDMFDQDLEDLPEEMMQQVAEGQQAQGGSNHAPVPIKQTTAKPPAAQQAGVPPTTPATPPQPAPAPQQPQNMMKGEPISEKQRKMLFAIQKTVGKTDDQIKEWLAERGVQSRNDIPKPLFQDLIDWIDPEFQCHVSKKKQEEDF